MEFLQKLEDEAKKQIDKYHTYHNYLQLEYIRKHKRGLNPSRKEVLTPQEWEEGKMFNPFYVLKNKKAIARSVVKKLKEETYIPFEPYRKPIPKKGGGFRTVNVFQIPDSVVSKLFYNNLLAKNRHRFSSFSYAYRNDRNVQFAIQDIGLDFKKNNRLFVAEFDFSKFFDTISHDFLRTQFDQNGFYLGALDRKIIDGFLSLQPAGKGIPQGTSISLFLANVLCWKLDRGLESLGLHFARYADDTVIWSEDYGKICKAFNLLHQFSNESGVRINSKKSEGISLLTPKEYPSELSYAKEKIDFLGYEISQSNISIKAKSVMRIKKEINFLLYKNLIQALKPHTIHSSRKTLAEKNSDKHLLRAIRQIRRYLYGNLTEYHLRLYSKGKIRKLKFKGVMSFYPLVDNDVQLKNLDRWLVSTILKSISARKNLTLNSSTNFPYNLNGSNIIEECRKKDRVNSNNPYEIPSFLRINNAIRRSLENTGIENTLNPNANIYNYWL